MLNIARCSLGFSRTSPGSGVPAGPQCHHSQSAAGTSAVEDQHAQMGAHGPTQNHHMTGPSEKLLSPNVQVQGTTALFSADMLKFKATLLNTCTICLGFF